MMEKALRSSKPALIYCNHSDKVFPGGTVHVNGIMFICAARIDMQA